MPRRDTDQEDFEDYEEIDGEEYIIDDESGNEMGDHDAAYDDMDDQDHASDEDSEPVEEMASYVFDGHLDSVTSLTIAKNGTIVSGGCDDKAILWNLSHMHLERQIFDEEEAQAEINRNVIKTESLNMDFGENIDPSYILDGHTDTVATAAFSACETYVATGGMDGQILVWNAKTGELVCKCEGCNEVEWIDWHPRGLVLAAGSEDGNVWMFQIPSGNVMQVFSGHSDRTSAGRFSHDGKTLYSVSDDVQFVAWDPKTANPTLKLYLQSNNMNAQWHTQAIGAFQVSADDSVAVTGSLDGTCKIISLKSGKVIGDLRKHTDSVESVDLSKQLSRFPYIASGSLDGNMIVWDMNLMKPRHICPHDDGVTLVKFHPTQPYIVTASLDRKVRVWDARDGTCLKTFTGHRDCVLSLSLSHDGKYIISGSDDNTCRIFEIDF